MVIFKAGRVKDILREAALSGYTIKCSELGYINADLFADHGDKFLNFLKDKNLVGNGQKNLLLLDLHSSHLFNAKFMYMMLGHNVEVCSFPPIAPMYSSHLSMSQMLCWSRNTKRSYSPTISKLLEQKWTPCSCSKYLYQHLLRLSVQTTSEKDSSKQGSTPIDPTVDKLKDLGPSIITDKCKSRVVCCPVHYLIDSLQFLSDLLDFFLDFQVKFMASGSAEFHTIKWVKFLMDFYLFF